MPKKKDNKYSNHNKTYTKEEIYENLTLYLMGFNSQDIAAGPGTCDNDEQYIRKQSSVSGKLADTMKDILNQNLCVSLERLAQLFVFNSWSVLLAIETQKDVPEAYNLVRNAAIEGLNAGFKFMIESAIIDLAGGQELEDNRIRPVGNEFTTMIDHLTEAIKDKAFTAMIGDVQKDPDILKRMTARDWLKIHETQKKENEN